MLFLLTDEAIRCTHGSPERLCFALPISFDHRLILFGTSAERNARLREISPGFDYINDYQGNPQIGY